MDAPSQTDFGTIPVAPVAIPLSPSQVPPRPAPVRFPDHLDLPETDGSIVVNFNEAPQARILTEAIEPVLRKIHPDGQFAVGENSGIYFKPTDPPLAGCRAPDWFYVPDVPPMAPGGEYRRSYVMWQEIQAPRLVIEFVSGNGAEERDRTPGTGKFWIYERAIRAGFYAIIDSARDILEVYELRGGQYEAVQPNSQGLFPIPPMNVFLGKWVGQVGNVSGVWARFYDQQGALLPTDGDRADSAFQRAQDERQRAEKELLRAEQERQRAEGERQRADTAEAELNRVREKLRLAGIDPDAK